MTYYWYEMGMSLEQEGSVSKIPDKERNQQISTFYDQMEIVCSIVQLK